MRNAYPRALALLPREVRQAASVCTSASSDWNRVKALRLRTDLEGPQPKTPEEALRKQAEQAGRTRVIPVYKSDGTTKIGVFVLEPAPSVTPWRAADPSPIGVGN